MKIIKRLIKYCILKIRLRNKVVFSFSVNIALSSKFEGMNKLHEHSSFCGKMGFGSYLGPNSYVVGNIGRFTSIAPFVRCNSGVHPYKLPYVTTSPSFYSLNLNHSQNGSTFAKQQMFKEHMFVDNDNKWIVNIGHDCWIGEHVFMVGGVTVNNGAVVLAHAVVTKDVPPYVIMSGNPVAYHGVNAVVLSQHHNTSERILRHIANAYRLIYQGNFSIQDAVQKIVDQVPMSEEIENIVNFVKASERGIVK